jgi:hypothetical protein
VIRDTIAQIEATKPAIREVQMDLFAESPLGPDAETVSDQKHSDQQLGIDRRAACVTVEISKVGTDTAQVDEPVDGSQQMIRGDVILERELVKQRRLRFLPRSHHRRSSPRLQELNQQFSSRSRKSFSTKYAHGVEKFQLRPITSDR